MSTLGRRGWISRWQNRYRYFNDFYDMRRARHRRVVREIRVEEPFFLLDAGVSRGKDIRMSHSKAMSLIKDLMCQVAVLFSQNACSEIGLSTMSLKSNFMLSVKIMLHPSQILQDWSMVERKRGKVRSEFLKNAGLRSVESTAKRRQAHEERWCGWLQQRQLGWFAINGIEVERRERCSESLELSVERNSSKLRFEKSFNWLKKRSEGRFVIVAIDYSTKWTEAEPLATITASKCEEFFWKNVVCRFGVPKILITNNGKQFDNSNFRSFCKGLSISLRFTSVAHPQSNGQTENMNRSILQGLKRKLDDAKGAWVDELPKVLWAYGTTPYSVTGETPFLLCFGTEALLPVEVGLPTVRVLQFLEAKNEENLRGNLDLLDDV
ncbi:hypothetical protein RJ639_016719 [Escallonia herrerae]|uniref:Integrase catalytic domain-containing protein n=1 Tax=Escallonia herrerae TaxID=1293975 RepID=A0AA88VES7_9ASTE|nr:hypothetical protein RJ639_016719 [Escallonia herrerae]